MPPVSSRREHRSNHPDDHNIRPTTGFHQKLHLLQRGLQICKWSSGQDWENLMRIFVTYELTDRRTPISYWISSSCIIAYHQQIRVATSGQSCFFTSIQAKDCGEATSFSSDQHVGRSKVGAIWMPFEMLYGFLVSGVELHSWGMSWLDHPVTHSPGNYGW